MWKKILCSARKIATPSPFSSTLQVPTTSLTLMSSVTDQQVPTTSLILMSSVTNQVVRAFSKKSGREKRNDGNAPKKKGNSKPKSLSKKNRQGSIKCSYCSETFCSPGALQQHQRDAHPDVFRPKIIHTCKGCGETYTLYLDFKNHECQRPVHWNRQTTDKNLKEEKALEKKAVAAKHQQERIEKAAAEKAAAVKNQPSSKKP